MRMLRYLSAHHGYPNYFREFAAVCDPDELRDAYGWGRVVGTTISDQCKAGCGRTALDNGYCVPCSEMLREMIDEFNRENTSL